MSPRASSIVNIFLLAALVAGGAWAAPWKIDLAQSCFVVVTHPDGVAASLAHPHVVVAVEPRTELDFDPAHPEATRFSFEVPVLALEVDAPETRAALAPKLREAGALDEPLKEISASTQAKIRRDMLDAGQLFAERYPEIRATLTSFTPRGAATAAGVLEGSAKVKIELRGMAVERDFPARITVTPGELRAHIVGELAFTDFGIKPYSALLGAIRNADRFHLFVEVVAAPAATPAP